MKAWPIVGIALMQAFLLAAHWFVYRTWIDFWTPLSPAAAQALRSVLFVLAFSFITAALLGFRHANWPVTILYRMAAIWLGFLNYFFWAACLLRLTSFALTLLGLRADRPLLAAAFFGLAIAVSIYGLANARFIRIRRIPIQLDGLPASWRGRTALVMSDLHLGHVKGTGFCRHVVALATRLNPDIVFLPGDIFDGASADADALASPLAALTPPFGSYFSTGNHDEFGNAAHYAEVLARVGVRTLTNEMVIVDGLILVGVPNGDSGYPIRLRSTLESLDLHRGQASILLNHVPNRLPIVEQAGVGLQISGNTHGGQLFPFTWFTRYAFGRFIYGLQRFGGLQIYTSSGAGSWGPPMRVGTSAEIVLLTFV